MITARLPITFVISFAFLLITPLSANAALYGDLNCDASVNVVDVQISILKTLGEPLDVVIDGDLNGIPDACVGDTGTTCGEGTVNADGVCVVDPGTLQDVADAAYAEGYSAGALDTLENIGSYTDGYNDALGICEDLGGSVGVCVNYEDLAILENMEASAMEVIQGDCLQDCLFVGDIESCLGDCVSTVAGLGEECASCFAEEVYCLIQACVTECIDPLSEACGACSTLQGCDTLAYKCAGLPEPPDPSTIGSCENEADNIILASFEESDGLPIECIQGCFFGTDTDGCYLGCFTGVGLSEPCSACYSQYMDCQFTECLTDCVAGQEACDLCLDEAGCNTELDICANGAPPVPVCESPFTELPVTPLNEDAAFQDFQNVCNSGGVLVVIDAEWNQAGPSYFDTYTDLLNVFGDCGLQIVLLYGEDAFMQTADSNTIQNVLENHFESGLPEGMHLAAMEGFGPISMILDFGGSVGLPTILFLDSELDVVPDFNMQADLNYAFFDNYFQGTC